MSEHGFFDWLHKMWPYIVGVFLSAVAVIKAVLNERSEIKSRIARVEIIAENNSAHLGEVLTSIKTMRAELREDNRVNTEQHNEIMQNVIDLFRNRM